MCVLDLPVIGNIFTWVKSNGSCRSRIVKFLMTEGLIARWDVKVQRVEHRDILDHCPIRIPNSKKNWGPKPFKVFNRWFNHPKFVEFVASSWQGLQVEGSPTFILAERLRS
ncbi:unnamed protein product [Lathyrus sativus]|nr:unnamed protein product [Lathyrus sativus]